ncbi:6883_t:CDS:2, partial [Rhizophagus irregularis]
MPASNIYGLEIIIYLDNIGKNIRLDNLAEAEADNLLPIDDQNLLPSQISSFGNDERIEIDDDDDERIEDDDDKRIEDVDSDDGEKIEDDDDERIEDVDGDDGERIEDDDDERIKDGNGNNGERIDEDESIDDDDDFHDGSYIAALDDLNDNNKQETVTWSSQTYKKFITAIIQYRISDAASLHLKTQDLVEFEGITYKLHYRLIIDAIKSLTSNQELCKEFFLDYKEEWESCDDRTLMRVYSEQNTAEWWHERESPFSKILAVMLYIDGTATTASATLSPQEFRLSHKVIKF